MLKHVHADYGFGSFPGLLYIVLVLSCTMVSTVEAQTSSDPRGSDTRFEYANFSPSMAIIVGILIAALFFMGFFSIYLRHCSQSATGNSVRQALSMRRRVAAPRGLDASVIETLPMFTYAEVKDHHFGKEALECAVCLNEFEDNETLRLIPKCDHVFHPDCIDAWFESHVTCPVCRADLTPKPDEPPVQIQIQQQQNEEVSEEEVNRPVRQQEEGSSKPGTNRNFSINLRNLRSGSFYMKRPGMFSKFRSNSTGHSVVEPGENLNRYTLRLPEEIRKEVMNRAWLNRTNSCAVTLRSDSSSRSGYRTGNNGEVSNRGGRSYSRIERSEPEVKSDRWVFSFLSRGSSIKSVKGDGEGSTSRGVRTAVKMPSFKCLEPKGDETSLV